MGGNGYVKGGWLFSSRDTCKERAALTVVVPPNYTLTQDGSENSPWNCSGSSAAFLIENQSRDFVFGLVPIPITADVDSGLLQSPAEEPAFPSLALTINPKPNFYTAPGQTILYTYVFENMGNVDLGSPFILEDDKVFEFECEQDLSTLTLQPGKTMACSAVYITGSGSGTIVEHRQDQGNIQWPGGGSASRGGRLLCGADPQTERTGSRPNRGTL